MKKLKRFFDKNKNGFVSLPLSKKILLLIGIFILFTVIGLCTTQFIINANALTQPSSSEIDKTELSIKENSPTDKDNLYCNKIIDMYSKKEILKIEEEKKKAEEEKRKSLINVYIKSSSVEEDLEISLRDAKNNVLNKDIFKVNVSSKTYNKDWEITNGWLKLNKLPSGEYTVTLLEKEGYISPEPIVCKVVKKAVFEKVDVADQVKNETQVDISKEDASFGQPSHGGGPTETPQPSLPSNTVDFVEPSQGQKEEIKENISYKYKPILSSNGKLVNIDGSESELFPILDTEGFIVKAFKIVIKDNIVPSSSVPVENNSAVSSESNSSISAAPIPTPLPVEEKIEVDILDNNNEPLKDSNGNYFFQFEKIEIKNSEVIVSPVYTGWQTIEGKTYYFDKDGNKVTGTQTINGVTYYFDSNGVQITQTVAVDVSKYQGIINWTEVKSAGVDYAIIRLGYRGYGTGALVTDSYYEKNMQGAINAGLKVGVYFFSQAINTQEAVEEASMCLDYVKKYNITLPIYFDTEYVGNSARADELSPNHRTTIAIAFCETIQNAGYKAGIYASKSWFYNQLEFNRISNYSIWVAHYTSADKTDFKYNYDIWQYTGSGSCPGIKNSVDKNILYKLF